MSAGGTEVMRWASAQATTVDGSASAPAWSFTNDLNTGIYRITTDAIGVTTGGTQQIRVDNTGVGIAMTPAYVLDVTSGNNILSRLQSTTTTGYISLHNSTTGANYLSDGMVIGMSGTTANWTTFESGVINLSPNNTAALSTW